MRGGVTCSMAAARAIMHAVTSSVPAQADRLMEETISGYRRGDFARVDFSRGVGGGARTLRSRFYMSSVSPDTPYYTL